MPAKSNVEDLLRKLVRPAQKVNLTRVKLPWRRRESHKQGIKLTQAERQELKEKREEKRVKLEDALNTARDTMFKMVEAMSEDFGKAHCPEYYYSLIMQQSKLKVKPQKFSQWNVFVSQETRKRNDGVYQRRIHASGMTVCISAAYTQMAAKTDRLPSSQSEVPETGSACRTASSKSCPCAGARCQRKNGMRPLQTASRNSTSAVRTGKRAPTMS